MRTSSHQCPIDKESAADRLAGARRNHIRRGVGENEDKKTFRESRYRYGGPMITLKVNGKERSVDGSPDTPLLWVLRENLKLTGTKFGCGMALCGACTVH